MTTPVATANGLAVNVLQEVLARGLGIVRGAVPSKTTLDILYCIVISTDAGRIRLRAGDGEVAITTWVGGMVSGEGAVAIPANLVVDQVGGLPPTPLALDAIDRTLRIKGARAGAELKFRDADDYPQLPDLDEGTSFTVDPKSFVAAAKLALVSPATDDSRPIMTGVNFVAGKGGKLLLSSADGFRATQVALPVPALPAFGSTTIPARVMREVVRVADKTSEPITITLDGSGRYVRFEMSDIEIIGWCIVGAFPDVDRVKPTAFRTTVTLAPDAVRPVLRGAQTLAKDKGRVRIRVIDDALHVAVHAPEIGQYEAECEITELEGEPDAKVALDSRYLGDAIGMVSGPFTIGFNSAADPVVLRPVEGDWIHIVMPLFVEWGGA